MSLSITNKTTPNTTYSQSVRSDEDKKEGHHSTHSAEQSGGRVLTAPKRKFSAHTATAASTGGGTGSTEPATTPTPAPKVDLNDLLAVLDTDYLGLRENVSVLEAQHEIAQACEAYEAEIDPAKKIPLKTILTDLTKKHETLVGSDYDPSRGDKAKDIKTALDAEKVKLSSHTAHAKAQRIIDGINREVGLGKNEVENIAKQHKGLGLWGWAGVVGLASATGIASWFASKQHADQSNNEVKELKAEVATLSEGTQNLFRQFVGQVVQPMTTTISDLKKMLKQSIAIQKQTMGVASGRHSSVSSKSVRSDDNSATGQEPVASTSGDPELVALQQDLDKLQKQASKQQASGGGKPAPAQPQGGGTSNTGAMPPQQPAMPQQNGQGGGSSMPCEPRGVRVHHPAESVPVVLGDKKYKFQNRDGQVMLPDGDD